jgi:hypothetical protein
MASIGPVSQDAYGPNGAGRTPPVIGPASVGPSVETTSSVLPSGAVVAGQPGTEEDVVAANVEANGSVAQLGAPTEDFVSATSKLAQAAANNVQRVGGRLDTQL